MALVSKGFELTVSLVDSGLNETTRTFSLRSADAATAATDVAALIADLTAVTEAKIKGYRISEVFVEDALALPAAGVHIENQALITVRLSSSPLKKATINIPAPAPGIFVAATGVNSNLVDLADTAVVDYLDNFVAAGTAFISDGESMAAGGAEAGKRIHQKSRRG